MAAGDINDRFVTRMGDWQVCCGTAEVSDTAAAFAIFDSKTSILFAGVTNEDGPGAIQCMVNSNNGTAGSLDGSLWMDNGAAQTDTVRFFCIAR